MKKHLPLLVLLLFYLFTTEAKANLSAPPKIDSLKTILAKTKDLHKQASLLLRICELERESGNYESALDYAQKAIAIADETDDFVMQGSIHENIGNIYLVQRDINKALQAHLEALSAKRKTKDRYSIAVSCSDVAQIYHLQNNYTEAIRYYEEALTIFKKLNDIWRIAFTSFYLGSQYAILSIEDKALENYYTSLEYYQKNNQPEGIIMAYTNIAAAYSRTSEYEKAPEYFKKAFELCEEMNDEHSMIHLYKNLGIHYYRHNQWDTALDYLFKAVDLAKKDDDYAHDVASAYIYIGQIKAKQNELDEALYYIQNSKQIYEDISFNVGRIGSIRQLAFVYYEQKKYELAKEHIKKSIEYHLKTKEKNPLFDDYRLLSMINESTGDYKAALNHHKLFKAYQDSLKMDDASKAIIKYEFDKKETELKAEQQIELSRKALVANTTYGVLGTVILLTALGLYTYWIRNKKLQLEKQNLELKHREAELAKETEAFKSQFLSNISHEFRTPLTLINGHLEVLKKEGDVKNIKRFNEMEYSGQRLLQLINQLLDLAKIETGKYSLYYKPGNLLNEVQNYVQAFHSLAEERQINLSATITFNARVKFTHQDFAYSSEALASILNNLLSNALKFTLKGGSVLVTIDYVGGKLYISVRDTGPGIPEKDLPHIFDRFYQIRQKEKPVYEGSGIGLAIVKELSLFHGGDTMVENNAGGGCTFTVWLAEGKEISEAKSNVAPVLPETERTEENVQYENVADDDKPLILVVEDQRELRKFIVENLGSKYRFLEAENGKRGIDLAIEHLPEIIISDVMMAEKTGFELVQTLKENEITSYIPILLLTAKADQDDKIEGLEVGADDYLVKPFSITELQLRVKNRLQQQQLLRNKFSDTPLLSKGETSGLNAVDQNFVEKLNSVVVSNIETEIDVSLLASEIGLSNSQLTRKLKVLIGVTPANFIKKIQLNYALELLRDGYTVSEAAWKSGFGEPAYFSKVFKKHFGFLPSDKESVNSDSG